MKNLHRISAICVLIISCLFLTNCSFSVSYCVINQSKSPIEVQYILTTKVDSLEHTSSKPFKTTLSNWNAWFGKSEDLNPVPENEYEFNPETRKCKITLYPNEVLQINWQSDMILSQENSENFYLESLKIIGDNGAVTYEGKYFYKQFQSKDWNHFFITYK